MSKTYRVTLPLDLVDDDIELMTDDAAKQGITLVAAGTSTFEGSEFHMSGTLMALARFLNDVFGEWGDNFEQSVNTLADGIVEGWVHVEVAA